MVKRRIPRIVGWLVCGAVFLVVLCVVLQFQACFWSRSYAQSQALSRVIALCHDSGRDTALLTGPRELTIGNARWAFEWIHEARPRRLYGVWISRSGRLESYGGDPDDPNSAASQSPP